MKIIKDIFAKRPNDSKKGDYGRLLVVGGSEIYTGAPALSALAALNTGCDLVTVAAPERAADIIASFSPVLITVPMRGSYLKSSHVDLLVGQALRSDAVVIGPGLSRECVVLSAVSEFMVKMKIPCVIDADAIYAFSDYGGKIDGGRCIVTAHRHEFFELTGVDIDKSKDKSGEVRAAAEKLGVVIILKGHQDIISDGKKTVVNETGNSYMTKGGTGDVLAGICGALLARGVSAFDAAVAGAYICGAAGDCAVGINGESLLATDVIDEIAGVINVNL